MQATDPDSGLWQRTKTGILLVVTPAIGFVSFPLKKLDFSTILLHCGEQGVLILLLHVKDVLDWLTEMETEHDEYDGVILYQHASLF